MGVNKGIISKQRKMLLCIIKNQIVMMQTIKILLSHEHFMIYGNRYKNKIKGRIAASKNIL